MKAALKHIGFSLGVLFLWATVIVWFVSSDTAYAAEKDPAICQFSLFDPIQVVDSERDINGLININGAKEPFGFLPVVNWSF